MEARQVRSKRARPPPDPDAEARLRRLAALMSEMTRMLPQMMKHGPKGPAAALTQQQMMLLAIVQTQGPMSVMGLRRLTGGAQSTLSELVTRMEKAGYVEKRPSPGDQRSILVASTAAGARMLEEARTQLEDSQRAILSRLDPADQERFIRAMETMMTLMARAYSIGPRPG